MNPNDTDPASYFYWRDIVTREPEEGGETITLQCGHSHFVTPAFPPEITSTMCPECQRQWIAQQRKIAQQKEKHL